MLSDWIARCRGRVLTTVWLVQTEVHKTYLRVQYLSQNPKVSTYPMLCAGSAANAKEVLVQYMYRSANIRKCDRSNRPQPSTYQHWLLSGTGLTQVSSLASRPTEHGRPTLGECTLIWTFLCRMHSCRPGEPVAPVDVCLRAIYVHSVPQPYTVLDCRAISWIA